MAERTEAIDTANETPARGRCQVADCDCKDVRIVLRRRAAFHAALAERRRETAHRVVAPEAGWRLPGMWG